MYLSGDWLSICAMVVSIGTPFVAFVMRSSIASYIDQKTRTTFEKQLENLRSDLRRSEDSFRSELQSKERHFSTLVESTLSARATRSDKVAGRKIEALESIWMKFHELSSLKFASTIYQTFKVEALEKEALRNVNLRKMLEQMLQQDLAEVAKNGRVSFERIYVPDIINAIHSAYFSILFTISLHLKTISFGMEDAGKLFNWDKIKQTVLAILPHQKEFLEKYGESGLPYLLEDIERLMLQEVRAALDGKLDDNDSLERARAILESARVLSESTQAQSSILT